MNIKESTRVLDLLLHMGFDNDVIISILMKIEDGLSLARALLKTYEEQMQRNNAHLNLITAYERCKNAGMLNQSIVDSMGSTKCRSKEHENGSH